MVLLQRVKNNSNGQTDTVQEVDDDDVHVVLRANRVSGDVLAECGDKDDHACKNGPNDLHEGDEDPEGSVVSDVLVLFMVENQGKHYLKEARIEHNGDDVMDGQHLLSVNVQNQSPNGADNR